jgi:gas vesicle protein
MSSNGNTVLGILAGTAVGAILGILFAPDKGENTRRKIAESAENTKNNLVETASDLKGRIANSVLHGKETLETRLESIVSDASYKADDVIVNLENKLRDLKEKNKKFQKL